jgi:hypothetical protein
MTNDAWPALPLDAWKDTYATLHMWTQIVGKVTLAQAPPLNHSWGIALHVTARGLTTPLLPHGRRSFAMEFDFVEHRLAVRTADGPARSLPLAPRSVAAFYHDLMSLLRDMSLPVTIWRTPVEIPDPIPFDQDEQHRSYDPEFAHRFWRILAQVQRVFADRRCGFVGKCSPVHFFWGAPDLAVTRFSGRTAPEHPGGIPNLPDSVTRDAYSHEVSSAGFWAGGGPVPDAVFYSYAYPEPAGFSQAAVRPDAAFYSPDLREFLLPYDAVRQAPSPDEMLLEFLQTTYEAAADLGRWDRATLERS